MRKHPGARPRRHPQGRARKSACATTSTLAMAKDIVYTHHERWDGSGYPQGLRGADDSGRRPGDGDRRRLRRGACARTLYRRHDVARRHRQVHRRRQGTHFDPAVVDAFVKVAAVIERVARDGD